MATHLQSPYKKGRGQAAPPRARLSNELLAARLAVDADELVGRLREGHEALGGHEAKVLQAHAEVARQVDARLDGDDGNTGRWNTRPAK